MAYDPYSSEEVLRRAAASRAATPPIPPAAGIDVPPDVAQRITGAPGGAGTPPPASGVTGGGRTPFYRKPINVPLGSAGRAIGGPAAIAAGIMPGAEALKNVSEWAADKYVGGDDVLSPAFRKTVDQAGGETPFMLQANSNRRAGNAPLDYSLAAPVPATATPTAPSTSAAPAGNAPAPATGLPPQLAAQVMPQSSSAPINAPTLNAPTQKRLGPLPTLDMTSPNQTIFDAVGKLGGDMNAYRQTAAANQQQQSEFNNQFKAGTFNLDALSKMANVQMHFDENARKSFDTQLKARQGEAQRVLASGRYDKGQEEGLRLLSGLKSNEYHPFTYFGDADPNTGIQEKVSAVLDQRTGQVIPISREQVKGTSGAKLPPGMKAQIGTSNGKPVYEDANGKRFVGK